MTALEPYPSYRDSGIPWLGEVPTHWEVRRLKRICRLEYGDALSTEMRQDGPVPVFGSNGRVGFHNSANTKAPCIVVGRKGSFGKVNYSCNSVYAIDTSFFIDSRFSDAHIRWLFFLLRWLRLDEVTKDSTVPGLDREDTYQRLAPVPPLLEQTAIVRFLNHVDWRIQRYIRAKQKLIALLKEHKQAIIHQAVTGRIDVRTGQPYPVYKPSDIEWLGNVPAHWEIKNLGRCGKLLKGNGGNKEDEVPKGVPCIRYGDLYTTHTFFITESRSYISTKKVDKYTALQYGDVLFAASGETIAEIGKSAVNLISSEACCGGDIILFRPKLRV